MGTEATSTNINVSCTSEYQEYEYNENHDVWSIVSLTAPCQNEGDNVEEKVPMDIVAVMDKSGSMAGEKLQLVKSTLEFVLTQLTDKDRLSLVTYDTNVYVDFALMNMSSDNKKTALSKIRKIRDGSSTNLCGGLMKGLCQIINRPAENKNDVASVLLFTDGLANQGIQDVNGIVAAMKDPTKFDGPAANSVGPSPYTIHPDASVLPTTSDSTVYTFGFGSDHNAYMLKQISDAGNGMYYFVETEDKIGESFAHCLGGLASTVAQGIQLEVTTEPGVTIKAAHTTRPCENREGHSIKVNIGDLQSEESRDILLELRLEKLDEPRDTRAQQLFDVNINYFNVNVSNLESASASLSVLRPVEATVHSVTNVNAMVTKERSRLSMSQVIKDASDKATMGDYSGARKLLRERIASLKQCKDSLKENVTCNDNIMEEYDTMIADLEDQITNTANDSTWNSRGLHLSHNTSQQYDCQRSSNPSSKSFQSPSKQKAVSSYLASPFSSSSVER